MSGAHLFLTGVTGFVGKVVLEHLLRRKAALGIDKVYVLIRPKHDKRTGQPRPGRERFEAEVASSRCFSRLPAGWARDVEVVAGDLTQPGLGLEPAVASDLANRLTHIINCAASVEFDLPLAEAAASNITSALNILELARGCRALTSFVNVSTAYVTPHASDEAPVPEALVPLPFDPEAVYQSILAGTANADALMIQTGHPNTYTFTKCLSEHLLERHKGEVPLAIVRPSIISASWRYPFTGWIDSYAAFAGFVSLIGAGLLKCVAADENAILDVVPVDEVSERVVHTAFWPHPGKPPLVQHSVSGVLKGSRNDHSISGIESFFQKNPVHRWAQIKKIGNGKPIHLDHLRHHVLPTTAASVALTLAGQHKQKRKITALMNKIAYLNRAFPYFTHHTFNFQAATPISIADFDSKQYIEIICRGVYENLMKGRSDETPFAGAKHKHPKPDLLWTNQQPQGSWAIRTAAYIVRKGLRRCTESITFDRRSFDQALTGVDPTSLRVVIPNHRSYMDFLLCSYLFFAHPELQVPIPQIAAASEFAKIPFLGWFFQKTHAFYIQRGGGKADPELTRKIQGLVERNQTLEFFIEGTRSRARKFLPPRRGLLRALQQTGIPCTLMPISFSYDLIPEEKSFLIELQSNAKVGMKLRALFKWAGRMLAGKVDLGRVHIVCGTPVRMDAGTDVYEAGRAVMRELQDKTAVSNFHLKAFLHKHPIPGIDVEWLEQALIARGARVISSPLQKVADVDPITELTLRYQWIHHFYADLLAAQPQQPALAYHVRENAYVAVTASETDEDPAKLDALLRTLFEPILAEFARVLALAKAQQGKLADARTLVSAAPGSFLPYLEDALAAFCAQGLLQPDGKGYAPGPRWAELESFAPACAWAEEPQSEAKTVCPNPNPAI